MTITPNSYLYDSFYKDTYEYYKSESDVISAGWFPSEYNQEQHGSKENVNLLTTPIHKIVENLRSNKDKPVAILLTTGGFVPLHQGHIDMMELSKKHLEAQGYFVAGGYFSTSHDDYVLNKYNTILPKANIRIQQISEKLDKSNWLAADPWEALFNSCSLNFTDVIRRLDLYLKNHLNIEFKIFYVFGSDNYGFHKAFIKNGYCCCVERNSNYTAFDANDFNDRKFYIKNNSISSTVSSSDIRDNRLPYLIRNDVSVPDQFKNSLCAIIEEHTKCPALWVNVEEQQKIVDNLQQDTSAYVLSLDKVTNAQFKIDVSRVFELGGIQKKPISMKFNGKFSTQIMFGHHKNSLYTIVDDDISSGMTIEYIINAFNLQISDEGVVSLTQRWYESKFNKPYNIHDIVDLRDFVFGAENGGLVVQLPDGTLGRVPYIFPFVNLVTRAKISPEYVVSMSRDIILINLDYFKGSGKMLKDCDIMFQNFMKCQDFPEEALLEDICASFLKMIK